MHTNDQQRNDIQGLRALAVLAVIVFHVNSAWMPGGFIGVDVFLVISGYLITGIILRQREQGVFSFASFYAARIRRILPAYMVLLAIVSLVMSVLLIPRDFQTFNESLRSALYFNSNHYFATHNDYFAPESHELPLLHTWSLAVEMQFYLLLPFLLIYLPRRVLAFVLPLLAAGILAYSQYLLSQGQIKSVYFSLAARIPEFLVGSLLALGSLGASWSRATRNGMAVVGLSLLFLCFWLISDADPFPGVLALPACVGVAMLIAARDSAVNEVLSCRVLVVIGALSYSLYLWHWPILAAFRYFFESYKLSPLFISIALLVTAIFSYGSYRLVEVPFRRKRQALQILPRYVVLLIFVAGAVLVAKPLNTGLVPAVPDEFARYAPQSEICHGQVLDSCARGTKQADKTILLLGDSHAAQLNYFAEVVGKELNLRFDVVTGSSCVPIQGFDVVRIDEGAQAACREQIKEITKRLPQVQGIILAGKWAYHVPSQAFLHALNEFMNRVQADGKPLLVLSQIPELDGNVQRIQRFAALGLARSVELTNASGAANSHIQALIKKYPGVSYLDLSSLDIFNSAPFSQEGILYFDSNHLNEVGSRAYGKSALPYVAKWAQENL